MILLLILISPTFAQVGTSSHACYNFPNGITPSLHFEAGLVWIDVEKGEFVYGAMQFWFENGQGGYFGGHYLNKTAHIYDFAIWDYSDTAENTSMAVDPWCDRFGGEGAGSHCLVPVDFVYGHEYRMKLSFNKSTSTQDWWTATSLDLTTNEVQYIGTLGLSNTKTQCPPYGNIKTTGNIGFQEYAEGGSFYTSFGWTGPYIVDGKTGTLITATKSVTCTVDAYHALSTSIPNIGTGWPYVFYEAGLNVTTTPSGVLLWSVYNESLSETNFSWKPFHGVVKKKNLNS